MITIRDSWDEFAAAAIPAHVSDEDRRQIRRAFYAGVSTMLAGVKRLSDPAIDAEEMAAALLGWERECVRYVKNVKAGRA